MHSARVYLASLSYLPRARAKSPRSEARAPRRRVREGWRRRRPRRAAARATRRPTGPLSAPPPSSPSSMRGTERGEGLKIEPFFWSTVATGSEANIALDAFDLRLDCGVAEEDGFFNSLLLPRTPSQWPASSSIVQQAASAQTSIFSPPQPKEPHLLPPLPQASFGAESSVRCAWPPKASPSATRLPPLPDYVRQQDTAYYRWRQRLPDF